MKRGLTAAFIIFLVLASVLVYAANESSQTPSTPSSQTSTDDVKKEIGNMSGDIAKKALSFLSGDFEIPENMKAVSKVILGYKAEESLPLEKFIVLIALWFILFLLMYSISQFVPFFNKGIVRFFFAIIITCLVGLSGGLRAVALFFFDLGNLFGFWEKIWWPLRLLSFAYAIAIIMLIGWGGGALMRMIRTRVDMAEAEKAGGEIGKEIGFGRAMREMWGIFKGR